jgi:hypothetical protein
MMIPFLTIGVDKNHAGRAFFGYTSDEMAVLPIVIGQDNPILRAKTKKVSRITKDLLKLIEDKLR